MAEALGEAARRPRDRDGDQRTRGDREARLEDRVLPDLGEE
jgi:hypothetical protein